MKTSFIYDIPTNVSNEESVKSVVLFDETFIKSLSLGGILKKFESVAFRVETILFGWVPIPLKELVMSRVEEKLDLNTTHLNNLD